MKKYLFKRLSIVAWATFVLICVTSCMSTNQCTCPYFADGRCRLGFDTSTHATFASRDTVADDSLLRALLDLSKYELVQYVPEAPKPLVWLDDSIPEDLSPMLSSVKTGNSRIMPRDVTMDNTENALYLYYTVNSQGNPDPLRLRLQYYADDPLQYYEVVFLIDGFEYRFKPENIHRGKGNGRMIWENSDDVVKASDKDLIYALSHCKWAEMTLLASNHINHKKELTEDQINDFYNVLQLYRNAGGVIE